MNIFKTFEIFLMEPLSVLKEKIVQIVNIQTSPDERSALTAEILGRKAQITVYNNEKMYSILKTAQYKEEKKRKEETIALLRLHQSVPFGKLLQQNR
jgi:hypothetical protein